MATQPYDIVNVALNSARVRLNDAITTLTPTGGQLLQNTAAFTQQVSNNAYRRLQEFLANQGYSKLYNEAVLLNIPATAATDPAFQAFIDWTGYNDGSTLNTSFVLPQDLIMVNDLWERVNGAAVTTFNVMDRVLNGLPAIAKLPTNKVWEWRDDRIYMPGATSPTDIRLRYASYLADFADNSPTASTPWYMQPIMIMRSTNALSWYLCYEVGKSRDDVNAAQFQAEAEAAALLLVERDMSRPSAALKTSEYSKMRDRFSPIANPTPGPARQ
jgi:hypothetical protein